MCKKYKTKMKIQEDSEMLYLKIKRKELSDEMKKSFLDQECILSIRFTLTGMITNHEKKEKFLTFQVLGIKKIEDIITKLIEDDISSDEEEEN